MSTRPHAAPPAPGLIPDALESPDAARYLGRSERTLRRWTAAGLVPSVTLGGRRYWLRSDLRALLVHEAAGTP